MYAQEIHEPLIYLRLSLANMILQKINKERNRMRLHRRLRALATKPRHNDTQTLSRFTDEYGKGDGEVFNAEKL